MKSIYLATMALLLMSTPALSHQQSMHARYIKCGKKPKPELACIWHINYVKYRGRWHRLDLSPSQRESIAITYAQERLDKEIELLAPSFKELQRIAKDAYDRAYNAPLDYAWPKKITPDTVCYFRGRKCCETCYVKGKKKVKCYYDDWYKCDRLMKAVGIELVGRE